MCFFAICMYDVTLAKAELMHEHLFTYRILLRLFYLLFYCDWQKFNLTQGFCYFFVHGDQPRNNIHLQRFVKGIFHHDKSNNMKVYT